MECSLSSQILVLNLNSNCQRGRPLHTLYRILQSPSIKMLMSPSSHESDKSSPKIIISAVINFHVDGSPARRTTFDLYAKFPCKRSYSQEYRAVCRCLVRWLLTNQQLVAISENELSPTASHAENITVWKSTAFVQVI
ncbi:hypothetical protein AVEN_56008-1 [Araneus ventricosus]|uniref:Uncharacterized protein n=1 Tax=Araneus ventricosus TaxID=182803 RepID=A0A4Y2KM13_ARAVE|nr:hypothetical protein AVEN_56008-1 [Araneus ventricosus]